MKKKKTTPLRINFQLKSNDSPKTALKKLDNIIDFSSAKRLFEMSDKISGKSKKELKMIYERMEEYEKALYRIWQIELPNSENLDLVIKELNQNSEIQFADVDELNILYNSPNDPHFSQMYNLKKIESECAWNYSSGEDIIVAVIDSGVNYNHPDIKNNMWQNQNGHFGYDFSDNDFDPIDNNGHGTHVAGTIAAIGNNNIGIIGVSPKAKIMAIKIFPNAYDSRIANAIKYAVDNGAKVLNNSWGPRSRRPSAPVLEAAVNYAYNKGAICVFAAGNSNDDVQYYSPANLPNTISVAATNSNDNRASFSNYGSKIDIAAPGVNILSLRHNSYSYRRMSGTSMSAPHVSGAIALLLSKIPNLNFGIIKNILKNTSDTINPDKYVGKGRLNVCKMFKANTSQRIKRSSIVETDYGLFSVNNAGKLVKINWTNSNWTSQVLQTWGSPIIPSSLISIGGGYVAGVNKENKMVVTYGDKNNLGYAIINQTIGIIAGTLRFSQEKQAVFALDMFGNIQYIKYHSGQWNTNIIQTWGANIIPESFELSKDEKSIYAINVNGQACLLWNDQSQTALSDGTKLAYADISQTSNLRV